MRQQVRGPYRDRVIAEAQADRKHRRRLRAIQDKIDLFGDNALNTEEAALVDRHHGFFFPKSA